MVELGRKRQLPVVDDLGWGNALRRIWIRWAVDQLVAELRLSLREGADLVLACGDKLVGGPQCGIILGRRSHVETLARHPLARALQLDKLALSALAGTLRLYRKPGEAQRSIPIWQLLAAPLENLKLRAERLAPQMAEWERSAVRPAEPDADDQRSGGLGAAGQANGQLGHRPGAGTDERGTLGRQASDERAGGAGPRQPRAASIWICGACVSPRRPAVGQLPC